MADNSNGSVTLKNWHVALVLISWLVICTLAYADVRAQGNENERRIHELESRPSVTQDQYQDGQRNLEQRLTRIENKLDDVSYHKH